MVNKKEMKSAYDVMEAIEERLNEIENNLSNFNQEYKKQMERLNDNLAELCRIQCDKR